MNAVMLRLAVLTCAAVAVPGAAGAQVIEIDSSGEARTFDRPTQFTAAGAVEFDRAGTKTPRSTTAAVLAEAARLHGVEPKLLEAVAWQESRGRMAATSPKGARGVMQLMPATAAELGVRPDDLVDNIRGGALYLRRQLDRFGSIPLALAAYNAGPGAVQRYGGIPPFPETREYVARIMARWRPLGAMGELKSAIVEVRK